MINYFIELIATNCGGATGDFLKLVSTEGSSTNFSVQFFEAGDVIMSRSDDSHAVYMVSHTKTEVNERGHTLHWYGIKEIKGDSFGVLEEFNETEAHSYSVIGKIDATRLAAYINLNIKKDSFGITESFSGNKEHPYVVDGKIDPARLEAYINLRKKSNTVE